ncbi:MAG: NAD(P)/FAD-dependent oxidoreductase [Actinomycetota bacterium]
MAGAALAAHIVRRGFSALVVERATFPSDTLSTHLFQNLAGLERLGVLDRLLDSGAPLLTRLELRLDDIDLSQTHPDLAMLSVRRHILDPILLDNAIQAGADAATRTRVIGLLTDGERVIGVRIRDAERRESEVRARVVVGADGRTSTVARLVGARRYNVTDSERGGACAYYEGVAAPPTVHFYAQGPDFFTAAPCDNGLFLAVALWGAQDYPRYEHPDGQAFQASLTTCDPLAHLLQGAQWTRPPLFIRKWQGYFRESAGRGWALVGDAGHFKDPLPGQGIADALRQAENLAKAICRGLETHSVEAYLHHWWRWRDQDAAETYWWARELGRAGIQSPVVVEMLRGLARDPKALRAFHEVAFHLRQPYRVLSPARAMAATARLLVRGDIPRGQVLTETRTLMHKDFRRRWRTRHPEYEP